MSTKDKETVGNFEVSDGGVISRREVLVMGAMAAGSLVAGTAAEAKTTATKAGAAGAVAGGAADIYKAKDFSALAGKLDGFTASQIEQHLKLYKGYIGKANELNKLLKTVDLSTANATYGAVREMLVEQSYAVNGVVYHEFYFGNLGGKGGEPTGDLKAALEDRWGSTGKFMDLLKAAGKSARGWVVVGYNARGGHLDVFALDLHNMHSPAGIIPILVLDVYEHAYMVDFGIDRGKYLEVFMKNLKWEAVAKRLAAAKKHASGWDATA